MNNIDILGFIDNLEEKTKKNEVSWNLVSSHYFSKIFDRTITDGNIKGAFYADSPKGRVIIGKYQVRHYYSEDEYYIEDYFFLSITNSNFENPVTFTEDDEVSKKVAFTLAISKLHRLIQLNAYDIKDRLDSWFD
ncbi:TPA: hypothetical protein ACR3Z0_000069 [Bacillus thuringiensis]|uniref:Uncharacterized protein n=1 Tax=Bacillus thuringiensis TaxID=1428 RepID=A0A9X6KTF6_BACTU|nr:MULTISPECIES: hypothetical protein [Bacillus cereus group]AJA21678.1 hypothetical protein BT4G5_23330 [Bacillus thuringiensis serovar galleriae]ETE93433.1 hypothetical protein C621_0209610 [Bacillus thuringiensis serovar aizawai str. Leapi01]ETE95886.1 hypothetical protein C623_0221170 [Bacillus thuringiensis serovar aizawai str. Hu4-2]KAB1381898.1 hypothetical protein FPG93_01625 [Bacillus thuringiensis]KLA09854.1 hypothetical protein B4158_5237 [Bacillus cereus]